MGEPGALEKAMSTHRTRNVVTPCRCESLEARLLLSADLPAAPGAELLAAAAPSLAALVPADVEQESVGGPSNNELIDAQPLQFHGILGDDIGPKQAVVTGTADGLGGGGDPYYDRSLMYGYISSAVVYDAEMINAIAVGSDGVLTITVKADLGGTEQFLTVEAEGVLLGDLFVDDGLSFTAVSAQVTIPQAQLAAMAADGTVEVTVTPSPAVARGERGYLSVELAYDGPGGEGTADYYSLELAAGESVSLSAAGDQSPNLQLVDADGVVLAEGDVESFVADQSGIYYARITGEGDYCLVANRNAVMDVDDNGSIDLAQPIVGPKVDARQWVVGSLTGDEGGRDSDFYSVDLSANRNLELRLTLPGVGADATIRLYDPTGNVVAEGTQLPNGIVVLRYKAPKVAGGEYYIEITADSDAQIDYLLSVKNITPARGQGRKG